ncbi:SDR family NAD(P)-dependent oxidoreductase [Nocardia brevicatena]|uniref:SDR family NAD(P)-dependent oxidoreductase n=1 Tax=Nocardia brevicatena TaxID=37327 RepID=UPI000594197D|nr:SDR family NAD(P)-dependent oxidoreductase [Nocardia brevicatena]
MHIAQGRVAMVTGGASGLGRHIAARLHEAGAAVAIVDIDRTAATRAAREIGPDALAVTTDVRSPDAVREAVARVADEFGGLDTIVISAGVFHVGALEDTSEDDWDRTLDINLKGAFLTIRAAAPLLRASGRGRIVTIGSDCGRRGFGLQVPYSAAKFGLIGLTEAVAAELAGAGVTANCVCPVGCPTTGMGQQVLEWKVARTGRTADQIRDSAAATNPLGRNATETDVADATLFFLSEHAGFLTGVTLDVDGGAHLGTIPGAQ